MSRLIDPVSKRVLRAGYRTALALHTFATARRRGGAPRVWYGGARVGDVGGTLVKLRRLTQRFPETRRDYNAVYLLSNAAYLPHLALARLRRAGVPIVLNQNGVFYPAWYEGDWRAMNERMALAYHAADHVFWQSDFCRRAADRFLGERRGPGEILFNAVDTRRFAPAEQRSPAQPFTFLMTGKIDSHMGYRPRAALEALAGARRGGLAARLVLAGRFDADVAAEIDARIAAPDLAGAVERRGAYTQAEAPALYAGADAYLALTFNDACPNAVIEAMACGLPVLFNDSGGTPELVGHSAGVGLAVPQGFERVAVPAAEAIAEGMKRIVMDRESMARAARARAVARFDIEDWLARHEQVFRRLIGGSP
ncbi:MAG: glycosyltransferase family 4 protein [Alphaproteobacteria bacterium]|nr:glycosyltransferase family 4 protein [Alphaproteobacteria bacterium]